MLTIEGTSSMSVQAKRWTREEYNRMAELGLLAPDSHVQLIEGEILQMAPPGARLSTAVGLVQDILHATFQGTALHVRGQQPVRIPNLSPILPSSKDADETMLTCTRRPRNIPFSSQATR